MTLLEKLRKSKASELDRSVPRLPQLIHVLRLTEEEIHHLIELEELSCKSQSQS